MCRLIAVLRAGQVLVHPVDTNWIRPCLLEGLPGTFRPLWRPEIFRAPEFCLINFSGFRIFSPFFFLAFEFFGAPFSDFKFF